MRYWYSRMGGMDEIYRFHSFEQLLNYEIGVRYNRLTTEQKAQYGQCRRVEKRLEDIYQTRGRAWNQDWLNSYISNARRIFDISPFVRFDFYGKSPWMGQITENFQGVYMF